MKKIGVKLVNCFILCMLLFVSVQTCVLEVGAYEVNTVTGQLLSYDIEMDDDYGEKDDDIYCTCEDCEAQRLASKNSQNKFNFYFKILCFIAMVIYAIFEIFFS